MMLIEDSNVLNRYSSVEESDPAYCGTGSGVLNRNSKAGYIKLPLQISDTQKKE
jgi:hypothetical protein